MFVCSTCFAIFKKVNEIKQRMLHVTILIEIGFAIQS